MGPTNRMGASLTFHTYLCIYVPCCSPLIAGSRSQDAHGVPAGELRAEAADPRGGDRGGRGARGGLHDAQAGADPLEDRHVRREKENGEGIDILLCTGDDIGYRRLGTGDEVQEVRYRRLATGDKIQIRHR